MRGMSSHIYICTLTRIAYYFTIGALAFALSITLGTKQPRRSHPYNT